MPEETTPRRAPPAVTTSSDGVIQFLLQEFEALRDFKAQADESVDKQSDVLIGLVSALGAGLAVLSQTAFDKVSLIYVALVAVVSLLLISLVAFRNIIRTDILTTNYTRAINRIRYYFAQMNGGEIRPYLLMPIDQHFPTYGGLSRNREAIAIINCLLLGGLAVLGDLIWRGSVTPNRDDIILLSAVFAASAVIHLSFASQAYRRASRRATAFAEGTGNSGNYIQFVERGHNSAQK